MCEELVREELVRESGKCESFTRSSFVGASSHADARALLETHDSRATWGCVSRTQHDGKILGLAMISRQAE